MSIESHFRYAAEESSLPVAKFFPLSASKQVYLQVATEPLGFIQIAQRQDTRVARDSLVLEGVAFG